MGIPGIPVHALARLLKVPSSQRDHARYPRQESVIYFPSRMISRSLARTMGEMGESPASHRLIVRSSRIRISTAKRLAERPDASMAARRSLASVTDYVDDGKGREDAEKQHGYQVGGHGSVPPCVAVLREPRIHIGMGSKALPESAVRGALAVTHGAHPTGKDAIQFNRQCLRKPRHSLSIHAGRDCPDKRQSRAYVLTCQESISESFR